MDRIQYTREIIKSAEVEVRNENFQKAWKLLEEAHVLSQPYAGLHFYVHWRMLILAFVNLSPQEIWGQFLRLLVAAPGSWSGRYPIGNTGRSNISMFAPMPVSAELSEKIRELER